MSTATIRNNLIYSKELKNWTQFRTFVKHLESLFASSKENGNSLIIEVWKFSDPQKEKTSQN